MSPEQEAAFARLKSESAYAEFARTVIEVTGEDRARFLHNYSTNDINGLSPGSGCEAFFTSVQGKTLLHAFVFCHDDRFVIDASADQADQLLPHLQKYAMLDDVELTDRSAESKQWLLVGANAPAVLSQLGLSHPEEMLSHDSVGDLMVRRVPLASVPSFLLQTKGHSDLAERLSQTEAELIEQEVVEALRIEARFPKFGQDVTEDNLPQEVSRDAVAISFTKGCYLGQETVARIDAVGHVNKYLVAFESSESLQVGDELFAAGGGEKVVGHLTSVSEVNGKNTALGYLRRAAIESKSSIETASATLRLLD